MECDTCAISNPVCGNKLLHMQTAQRGKMQQRLKNVSYTDENKELSDLSRKQNIKGKY